MESERILKDSRPGEVRKTFERKRKERSYVEKGRIKSNDAIYSWGGGE